MVVSLATRQRNPQSRRFVEGRECAFLAVHQLTWTIQQHQSSHNSTCDSARKVVAEMCFKALHNLCSFKLYDAMNFNHGAIKDDGLLAKQTTRRDAAFFLISRTDVLDQRTHRCSTRSSWT